MPTGLRPRLTSSCGPPGAPAQPREPENNSFRRACRFPGTSLAVYVEGGNHVRRKHPGKTPEPGDTSRLFMMIVKANEASEAGVMPSERLLTEMGKFNEELVKAGVLRAGEGLHPSSKGARVKFSGATRTVVDGPFSETKELVAGFWLI